MKIYPHQMIEGGQFYPFFSPTPISPATNDESKVLAFDVEVPDNLFGTIQVKATPVEEPE